MADVAARHEAALELVRLLALERREVAATGVLRGVLDARYLGMRKALTRVVSGAALYYDGGWDAAALCMALLDAWRAAAGAGAGVAATAAAAAAGPDAAPAAGPDAAPELAPELAAVGLLAAALCFLKDPMCGTPGEGSLKLLAERWCAQAAELPPRMRQRLGRRPAALQALAAARQRMLEGMLEDAEDSGWVAGSSSEERSEVSAFSGVFEDRHHASSVRAAAVQAAAAIRAAQAAALATVDWRLMRATAGALVDAMVGVAPQDAEVEEQARKLCWVGLLRGSSLFYGQSVLAAASLLAARTMAGVAPAWPGALAAFGGMLVGSEKEAEHCARDLLHAQELSARTAPRTPRKRRAKAAEE